MQFLTLKYGMKICLIITVMQTTEAVGFESRSGLIFFLFFFQLKFHYCLSYQFITAMINHISISFSAVRIQKKISYIHLVSHMDEEITNLYFCSIIYRQCLRFWAKSTERNKYGCLMTFT